VSDAVQARERPGGRERCAFCHEEFAAQQSDPRVSCEGCGTPHHAECFEENGGCSSLGCARVVARDEGGSEVHAAPVARPREPARDFLTGPILPLIALAFAFLVEALGGGIPGAILVGTAVLACGAAFRRRVSGARTVEDATPAPFAIPVAPPQDAVEAVRRLNVTPSRRSTGTLPEPSGPNGVCPACSQPLEAVSDLGACYHCGAALS
jgi:hypothetical protein